MNDLDASQQLALLSTAPRKVIAANAGSGKTRTLVALVARECTRYPAQQVAVLTFTNAAADEIKDRLAKDAHMDARLGFCGTLHSFLFMLLRSYPEHSGLPGSIALVEPETADELLDTIRDEMGAKVSWKRLQEVAKEVYDRWVASSSMNFPIPDSLDTRDVIVAKAFYRRLITSGLITFDTLLVFGLRLVRALTDEGKWLYRAILWDEGQDGSAQDFDVLEACGAERKVIVGDPDQSIFGFRKAAPGRLTALCQVGSEWETIKLETNYRSTVAVCQSANSLISHNHDRLPKVIIPIRSEQGVAESVESDTQAGERANVLYRINNYLASGSNYCDIAILARTRHRAGVFSEALLASGIPVRTRPEEPPAPKDWKAAKLLLTVAAAPWSDFAVTSYVAAREGKEIAEKLRRKAQLESKTVESLYFWEGALMWHLDGDSRVTPDEVADMMERNNISRESVKKARAIAASLGTRLDPRNLAAALSEPLEKPDEGDMRGVTVSTVHAAKGREFRHVFVVGMEEGTFPSGKSDDIEEERRLFFVALTRAKDTVTCTWCRELPSYRGPNVPPGPPEVKEPSRFLAEANLC